MRGRGTGPDQRIHTRHNIFGGRGHYKRQHWDNWLNLNMGSMVDNNIIQDTYFLNLITALFIQEIVIFRRYTLKYSGVRSWSLQLILKWFRKEIKVRIILYTYSYLLYMIYMYIYLRRQRKQTEKISSMGESK